MGEWKRGKVAVFMLYPCPVAKYLALGTWHLAPSHLKDSTPFETPLDPFQPSPVLRVNCYRQL